MAEPVAELMLMPPSDVEAAAVAAAPSCDRPALAASARSGSKRMGKSGMRKVSWSVGVG